MAPSEITVGKVLDLIKQKLSAPWANAFASEPHNTSNLLKHKVSPRLLWTSNRIAAHVIMSSGDDADSWMYLFADLSCVVIFYKACLVVLECGTSLSNLAVVGLMFWIVFATRLYFDDYSNRFTAKFNRLMCFIYSIGMFLMALNVSAFKLSHKGSAEVFEAALVTCTDSRNAYFVGFAYGFLLTRAVLITIYTRLMSLDINCYRQFRLDLFRFCCAFAMVAVGCIVNGLRETPFSAEEKILFFLVTTILEWGLLVVDMWIMASVRDTISLCPCVHSGRSKDRVDFGNNNDSIANSNPMAESVGQYRDVSSIRDNTSNNILNVISDNRLATVDNSAHYRSADSASNEHPVGSLDIEERGGTGESDSYNNGDHCDGGGDEATSCQMVFNYFYPLDIYRHQSRLGLFIMMILGEVVLELGLPPYSDEVADDVSNFAFFTLVLSFSFGIQYYDCVHRLPGSPHAMQRSALSAFVFTWLHVAIGYCMLLVTVASSSYYAAVHHSGSTVSMHWRKILCYTCASVVFFLTFTRLLHKGLAHGTLSPLYQCRILFLVAHVLVQYTSWDYRYDIVAHAMLALVLACIDLLGYKIKEELGVVSPQSMHMKKLLLGLTGDGDRSGSAGAGFVGGDDNPSGPAGIQPLITDDQIRSAENDNENEPASSLKHSLSLSDSLYARRSFHGNHDGGNHHATLTPPGSAGSYVAPTRIGSISPTLRSSMV